MLREIILTADGSHTVSVPQLNATYHSVHGAIQESLHVFIEAGLHYVSGKLDHSGTLNILEIGFGTGLNALLTLAETEKNQLNILYSAIELYPLSQQEAFTLNYCDQLSRPDLQPAFLSMHQLEWEKPVTITPRFTLLKINQSVTDFLIDTRFHLIYFDAFDPATQPELWTEEIFKKLYSILMPESALVTYCSKGDVRRAMEAAGFTIQKLPGPPGKREIVRAVKQ